MPLATLLGWVTAKEDIVLTENKKRKILHAYHRKMLNTKILSIKNIIMSFDIILLLTTKCLQNKQ